MVRKIIIPILLILPYAICFGQDTDVELWLSANIHKDFKKKYRLFYEQGYRSDHNITETKTFYFDVGGLYKPWKFLWIGPYYRYFNDFKGSEKSHLAGVLFLREEMGRFDLKSKTKYIYEFEKGDEKDHYIRQKLTAAYDIPKFKFNPFLSTELIFHMQPAKTETEEIRLEIGFERNFGKHHSVEVWYRYNIERNVSNPINSHIIGIDYAFEF
jgi:hypothetical protein